MPYKFNPFTGKLDLTSNGGTTLPAGEDGEALIYENGQWVAGPVIGGVDYTSTSGDASFSNVEFLINPEGSNGSTSFTDLSDNAATISVTGNPAISTSQYKFGLSSVYFNGSRNDFLSIPNASWMSFGSNDFTIEAWVYINGNSNYNQAQHGTDDKRSTFLTTLSNTSGDANNSWDFRFDGDSTTTGTGLRFIYRQGNSLPINFAGTVSIAQQTWHHVAAVRNGNTIDLYLNGTSIASQDVTGVAITSTQSMVIGTERYGNQPTVTFDGYIDGLRITSGVARYTSAFTPPTSAFLETGSTSTTVPYSIDKLDDVDTSTVAPTDGQALLWDAANSKWEPGTVSGAGTAGDSYYNNVEVLLHFDGTDGSTTFTDDSKNSWTVTANNAAQISTTQSKFGGSSFYSGASTLFNAAVIADNDALTFDADFTIEAWIYKVSAPASNDWAALISKYNNGGEYNLLLRDNSSISFGWRSYAPNTLDSPLLRSGANSIPTNTWTHIAVTRSGNDFKMFIDGAPADSATESSTPSNNISPLTIGAFSSSEARRFNGYIDEVRLTKGVARYTAAFSTPTAAFPNTTATTTSIGDSDDVDITTVAPTDGTTLVYANGDYVTGPVIGGVDSTSTTYTIPTGFNVWNDTFTIEPSSQASTVTLTNGDRTAEQTGGVSIERNAVSTSTKSTGKWYWEILIDVQGTDSLVGITQNPANGFPGDSNTGGIGFYRTGQVYNNSGATASNNSAFVTGDTLMLALDADAKKLWYGKNGTWDNSGDPAAGTGALATNWTGTPDWYFACRFKGLGGEKYTLAATGTVIPYSIDNLDDVDTSTVAPTDGQALVWDNTASKWEPGSIASGTPIENNRVETFTYEVSTFSGSNTEPAAPGDVTIRSSSPRLFRIHEQDRNGKYLLLTDEYSSPSSITIKRNGSDVEYPIATYGLNKQFHYFQFGTTNTSIALGDTLEFTFIRPVEGDYASLKADLTSYETVNGDVVRGIKPNDKLLTAASTVGNVYDSFQAGSPGSPTADGQYAIRYLSSTPLIRVWPNDANGNAMNLRTVSYTGAIGTTQKPFFYAWADGILYKIPISSQIYLQSGYYQWYCAGGQSELGILQNAGSFRLVLPWEAYEDPQDGDVLTYDSTNKTYHPKGIRTLLGIDEYASDSAAGTGGLSSGELYYNTTSSSYVLKT